MKTKQKIEPSHDGKAAIDGERRPGDERGFVAGEPQNRPSNLLRRRPAPEQRCRLARGLQRLDARAGALGFRDMEVGQLRAGTDRVDGSAVRHVLEGGRGAPGPRCGMAFMVEATASGWPSRSTAIPPSAKTSSRVAAPDARAARR